MTEVDEAKLELERILAGESTKCTEPIIKTDDEWDSFHKRFRRCPNNCREGKYFDMYAHKFNICTYCAERGVNRKVASDISESILKDANIFEQYREFKVKGLDELFSGNDSWYIKFKLDIPSNLSEWATGIIVRLAGTGDVSSIRYIEGLEQSFALKYKDLEVLVLAYETKVDADILFELLAYRYNRGLRTIILSKSGYKLGLRLKEFGFIVKGE